MPGFDVQRVIAAFAAGKQIKEQKEKQARDIEDREHELKQRQAQAKLDKINLDMLKRQLEQQNATAMQGQPGPEVQTPMAPTFQAPIGDEQTGQVRQPEGSRTIPLPLPEMQISGVEELGVPGYSVRPQSMQQLREQQLAAERQKAASSEFTLNPGDVRFRGGSPIASNPKPEEVKPPTENNQQYRDVERGGKTVRQYFKGSDPSKVTFEVDMGAVKDKTDDPLTAYQRNQTFLNISNRYQADQIVNQSIKGQTAKAIADQIIKDPTKATNQLSSLYLFVKNLDPDSAVREGEIGLARQTQSYLQNFGVSLTRIAAGQVLSPESAKQLAQATKDLIGTWESTAKLRTQQYKSQADTAGIGQQFGQYLTGIQGVTAPAPEAATRPRASDGKGNFVEFDGAKWVPVK